MNYSRHASRFSFSDVLSHFIISHLFKPPLTGHLNTNMLLRYKSRHDLGSTYLDHVKGYSFVGGSFLTKHVDPQLEITINKLRDAILDNTTVYHSIHEAVDWVDNMTVYIDQLHLAKLDMADYITEVNYSITALVIPFHCQLITHARKFFWKK